MAIRVIVDSNFLSSAFLRSFLELDREHFAVITDYAWMEAYKSKSIAVLTKSLSVIGDHPEQTILLKGTKKISALDYRSAGVANQMEWKGARAEFVETVEKLRSLDANLESARFEKNDNVRAALEHIDGHLLIDLQDFSAIFADIQKIFSNDEIATIRTGETITLPVARKIFGIADGSARILAKKHPFTVRGASLRSKVDSFVFRFVLANVLNLVDWIRQGSQSNIRNDRLRNDLIDLNFATYATYFNGVFSDDQRLRNRHDELRVVLRLLGGRMPPDWIDLLTPEYLECMGSAPISNP